jgi:hypothetical protein
MAQIKEMVTFCGTGNWEIASLSIGFELGNWCRVKSNGRTSAVMIGTVRMQAACRGSNAFPGTSGQPACASTATVSGPLMHGGTAPFMAPERDFAANSNFKTDASAFARRRLVLLTWPLFSQLPQSDERRAARNKRGAALDRRGRRSRGRTGPKPRDGLIWLGRCLRAKNGVGVDFFRMAAEPRTKLARSQRQALLLSPGMSREPTSSMIPAVSVITTSFEREVADEKQKH